MTFLKAYCFFEAFRQDTRGATAIEYGLIAAGIAVAIAAAVFLLGDELNELFGGVTETLKDPEAKPK